MAYTTSTLVIAEIGVEYDSTTDLTATNVTDFIAEADKIVNDAANERYVKFNAIGSSKTDGTDTYLTPGTVALASKHLATALCLKKLRAVNANATLSDRINFNLDQAEFYLAQLRDPTIWLTSEKYRNMALTFAASQAETWTLPTNEAFIATTSPLDSGEPPNIYRDSVVIGSTATTTFGSVSTAELLDMRNGIEFSVRWAPEYKRWIFTALHEALYSTLTTLKITFEWDYQRLTSTAGDQTGAYNGLVFGG